MAASQTHRDRFGVPSKEWLENNPEARGLGFQAGNLATAVGVTGNLPTGVGRTGNLATGTSGSDQPLALVKGKKSSQPKTAPVVQQSAPVPPPVTDGPLDLSSPLDLSIGPKAAPSSALRPPPIKPQLKAESGTTEREESPVLTKPLDPHAASAQEVISFRCCFCGLAFTSTEVLLQHIRIHTGDEEGESKDDDDVGGGVGDKEDVDDDDEEEDGSGETGESSSRVSPDTVSGSRMSLNQDAKSQKSRHPGKVVDPKVLSTPATEDPMDEGFEEEDQTASPMESLTRMCEADSTSDIPMNISKAKMLEPSTSGFQAPLAGSSQRAKFSTKPTLEEGRVSKYQCPICRVGFKNHFEQQQHQVLCRPPTEKQFFLQAFSLNENLTCAACNFKFPSADSKNAHHCHGADKSVQAFNYMYSISDQVTSERHYDAGLGNFSSEAFYSTQNLENDSNPGSGRSTPESKKSRHCEACDKTFEFSRNLSRHLQCNPTCRAVMVAKDPGSVKKGGYRVRYMKPKSVEEGAPGTSEQRPVRQNLGSGVEIRVRKKKHETNIAMAIRLRKKQSWSSTGYVCKVCGKTFKDGLKLGVHTRWEHRPGMVYTKPKGKKWKQNTVRKSDRNSTNQLVSCLACQKTFKLESQLELHLNLKKKCQVQHTRMLAEEEARAASGEVPPDAEDKRPMCKICHHRYWSTWHLKSHMRACHSDQTIPEALYTDSIAGMDSAACRQFYQVDEVKEAHKHLESKKGMFSCKFCQQGFRQKKIGYTHVLIHLKINPYRCMLCDYRGRQVACILKHLKNNHQNILQQVSSVDIDDESSASPSPSPAREAPRQSENALDLSSSTSGKVKPKPKKKTPKKAPQMVKTSQPLPASPPLTSESMEVENLDFVYSPNKNEADLCQEVPNGWKCPFCEAVYGSKSRTVCHIRKHTRARPYKCCYCTFTASYSYMIYQHLRKQHSKNRPIRAPPRVSRGRGRHVASPISPQARLPSPQVGNSQTQVSPSKFPKNPMYYSSFFKALPIDNQYAPIHIPERNLWKCYACEKTSEDQTQIQNHALIHMQMKPFHCLLCQYKSSRLGVLISHLQEDHKTELEAHFGSNVLFEDINQGDHVIESVHARDIQDLHTSSEESAAETGANQAVLNQTHKDTPKSPTETQQVDGIDLRRRSSRGRQIKPQKSLQEDYVSDFTESESDTPQSQHRNTPRVDPKLMKLSTSAAKFSSAPTKQTNVPSESPSKESGSLNVVVLPGCREKIYLCPHCNFKSNDDSVIQAHLALKHNIGQLTNELSISQAGVSVSTSGPKTAKDVPPQNVLSWFPHQWGGAGDTQNMQSEKMEQENGGPSGTRVTKLQVTGAKIVTTSEEIMNTANTLYSYKAGPVEQSANFNTEPQGGFKCSYCEERPQGKASAIAHLQVHTGEKPYSCDLCVVKEADRVTILNHIQEGHSMQVLDIIQKKRQLLETSSMQETSASGTDLEDEVEETSAYEDVTSADDTDMNENSPSIREPEIQLSKAVPITQMLGSAREFRLRGIRKKNLNFYKQIIFIRGPKEEKLHIEQDKITGRYICPYCKKTFSGRNATKQHSRIHTHEKPYYCKLCYHNARNISSIMKHLQAIHRDYCKGSKVAAKTAKAKEQSSDASKQDAEEKKTEDLEDKMEEDHRQDNDEESQNRKDDDVKENEEVEQVVEAKRPRTPVEEIKRPESPSQILQEFFEFQQGEVEGTLQLQCYPDGRCQCPFCGKMFVNTYNTKRHIRIHTEEKPYVCKLCDYRGIQYNSIYHHLVRKHPEEPKIADLCMPKGQAHEEERDDAELCDEGMVEEAPEMDKVHDNKEGKEVREIPQPVPNDSPGKRYWNAKWVKYYQYEPGPLEEKFKDTRRHVPSGCYKCPICKKKLKVQDKTKFLSHLRAHSGEKPYRCKLCGYKAGSQSTIVHHVSNFHKLEVEAAQEDESKESSRPATPNKENPSPKKVQKEISTPSGVTSGLLSPNQQEDTTPESSPEKGNSSDRPWVYIAGEIETSLNLEKNSETDDFTCPHCDKGGFKCIRAVKAHIRTHTNEMPYKCKICEYSSRQQSSMRYHCMKEHKLLLKTPTKAKAKAKGKAQDVAKTIHVSEAICDLTAQKSRGAEANISDIPLEGDAKKEQDDESDDEGTKDFGKYTYTRGKMEKRLQRQMSQLQKDVVTGSYLCSYCAQGLGTKSSYVVHVRSHTGEKPYACKRCDYRATQRNSIMWHINTHHNESKVQHSPVGSTQTPEPHDQKANVPEDPQSEVVLLENSSQIDSSNQPKQAALQHTCKRRGEETTKSPHESDLQNKVPEEDVEMINLIERDLETEATADRTKGSDDKTDDGPKEASEVIAPSQEEVLPLDSSMEEEVSPTSHTGLKKPQCVYMHKTDTHSMENYLSESESHSKNIARLFFTFSIGMVERNLNIEVDQRSRQYICPFCSGLFRSLEEVRQHGRLHTGERPYCCSLCTRREFRESKIIQHIVGTHKSAVRKAARKGSSPSIPAQVENEECVEEDSSVHQLWGCISPYVTYSVDIYKKVCYVCDLCNHKIAGYPQIITHLSRFHKVDVHKAGSRATRDDQGTVYKGRGTYYSVPDGRNTSAPTSHQVSPRNTSGLGGHQVPPSNLQSSEIQVIYPGSAASAFKPVSPSRTTNQISPGNMPLLTISTSMPPSSETSVRDSPTPVGHQISPTNTLVIQVSPVQVVGSQIPHGKPSSAVRSLQLSPRKAPVHQLSPGSTSGPSILQPSPRSASTPAAKSHTYTKCISTPATTPPKQQDPTKAPPTVNSSLFSVDEKQKLVVINQEDKATKQSFVCNKCGHMTHQQDAMVAHITATHPEAVLYVNPMHPAAPAAPKNLKDVQRLMALEQAGDKEGTNVSDKSNEKEDCHMEVQTDSTEAVVDMKESDVQEPSILIPQEGVSQAPVLGDENQTNMVEKRMEIDEQEHDAQMPKPNAALQESTPIDNKQNDDSMMTAEDSAGTDEQISKTSRDNEPQAEVTGIRRSGRIMKIDEKAKASEDKLQKKTPEDKQLPSEKSASTAQVAQVVQSTDQDPTSVRRSTRVIEKASEKSNETNAEELETPATDSSESQAQAVNLDGKNLTSVIRRLNRMKKLNVDVSKEPPSESNYMYTQEQETPTTKINEPQAVQVASLGDENFISARRSNRVKKPEVDASKELPSESNTQELEKTATEGDEHPAAHLASLGDENLRSVRRSNRVKKPEVDVSKESPNERNTQELEIPVTESSEPQAQVAGQSDEDLTSVRRSNRMKKPELDVTKELPSESNTQELEKPATESDEHPAAQAPSLGDENLRSVRKSNPMKKLEVDVSKEPLDSMEMEEKSPRSAIEHNYARNKTVVNSNTATMESMPVLTPQGSPARMNVEASPRRKVRRRSTRRQSSDFDEPQTSKMTEAQSGENLSSISETAAAADSLAMSLPLLPLANDVMVTKSREVESVASSDQPASECSSTMEKLKDDKLDDTTISDYFTVTIGNAEKSLSRNVQRDKATGYYICPYCDKSARLLQTTKIHMRLHTGEKPYQCKICDLKTVQHCSIISHIKNHHPEVLGLAPKEPKRTRKRSKQRMPIEEGPALPLKLANRVKKLGSTSPMKTNYKKVSKKLRTAEEEETFVDMQRSQQIYDEAKQMELSSLQAKRISPSEEISPVVRSEGIGISGLKRFAQIPIPKLGVANLTEQFLQVAMEKPLHVVDQHRSVSGTAPVVSVPDASKAAPSPVPRDLTSADGVLDLSLGKGDALASKQTTEDNQSGLGKKKTSSEQPSKDHQSRAGRKKTSASEQKSKEAQSHHAVSEADQPAIQKKSLKRKLKNRRKRGKKIKRSKGTEVEQMEPVSMETGDGEKKNSKHHILEQFYAKEIGPIEKSLVFEKDPVTQRVKCPYCSQTLSHVWGIYNHVRLHTGEKPFKCKLCGYKAVQLTSMKTHLHKNHTGIVTAALQRKPIDLGATGTSAGPKSDDLPSVPSEPKSITGAPSIHKQPTQNKDLPSTSTGIDLSPTGPAASNQETPNPSAAFNVYNCFTFVQPVGITGDDYKKDPVSGLLICPHCNDPVSRKMVVEHISCHTGDLPYRCKFCETKATKRSAIIRHVQMYHKKDSFSQYVPQPGGEVSASSTMATTGVSESAEDHVMKSLMKVSKKKIVASEPSEDFKDPPTKVSKKKSGAVDSPEDVKESPTKVSKKKNLLKVRFPYKKPAVKDKPAVMEKPAAKEIPVARDAPESVNESPLKVSKNKNDAAKPVEDDEDEEEHLDTEKMEEEDTEVISPRKMSADQNRLCRFYSLRVSKEEKHLVIHKIGRSYACPFCPSSFVRSADVKRHARVHTGDNPYKCKLCPKETRQQTPMLNHIGKMHAAEVEEALKKESESSAAKEITFASVGETSHPEKRKGGDDGSIGGKHATTDTSTETSESRCEDTETGDLAKEIPKDDEGDEEVADEECIRTTTKSEKHTECEIASKVVTKSSEQEKELTGSECKSVDKKLEMGALKALESLSKVSSLPEKETPESQDVNDEDMADGNDDEDDEDEDAEMGNLGETNKNCETSGNEMKASSQPDEKESNLNDNANNNNNNEEIGNLINADKNSEKSSMELGASSQPDSEITKNYGVNIDAEMDAMSKSDEESNMKLETSSNEDNKSVASDNVNTNTEMLPTDEAETIDESSGKLRDCEDQPQEEGDGVEIADVGKMGTSGEETNEEMEACDDQPQIQNEAKSGDDVNNDEIADGSKSDRIGEESMDEMNTSNQSEKENRSVRTDDSNIDGEEEDTSKTVNSNQESGSSIPSLSAIAQQAVNMNKEAITENRDVIKKDADPKTEESNLTKSAKVVVLEDVNGKKKEDTKLVTEKSNLTPRSASILENALSGKRVYGMDVQSNDTFEEEDAGSGIEERKQIEDILEQLWTDVEDEQTGDEEIPPPGGDGVERRGKEKMEEKGDKPELKLDNQGTVDTKQGQSDKTEENMQVEEMAADRGTPKAVDGVEKGKERSVLQKKDMTIGQKQNKIDRGMQGTAPTSKDEVALVATVDEVVEGKERSVLQKKDMTIGQKQNKIDKGMQGTAPTSNDAVAPEATEEVAEGKERSVLQKKDKTIGQKQSKIDKGMQRTTPTTSNDTVAPVENPTVKKDVGQKQSKIIDEGMQGTATTSNDAVALVVVPTANKDIAQKQSKIDKGKHRAPTTSKDAAAPVEIPSKKKHKKKNKKKKKSKVDEYEFDDNADIWLSKSSSLPKRNQLHRTTQTTKPYHGTRVTVVPSPGPSSSYHTPNRSTPPSSAMPSSTKSSPRGGTQHYSYIPSDEDTCDVVKESNNISMFQCPHCTYRHRTRAVVRIHIRTHTKHKPYFCHYCQFKSTHCATIKRHLWKEHGKGTDPSTSEVDTSKRHKSEEESPHYKFRPSKAERKLVLKPNQDGFICSYCERPFTTEGNLRIHIRTHTGDKPYHCRYCEFRAAYGFVMQKHINMSHKEPPPSDTDDDKPALGIDYTFNPSERETSRVLRRCPGSDMYKCEVCGRESVHEHDAVVHMRSHTGDAPYYCAHCDTHTMTQLQIVKHVTNMHKPMPKKQKN